MKRINLFLIALTLALPWIGNAQEDNAGDNEELKIIEVELEKSATKPAAQDRESNSPAAQSPQKAMDFSGLGRLAPFTEVSVIQKRYMPKTGRFQLFGGLTLITNDPFNNSYGGVVKGGYFFTESIGLELNYFGLSSSSAKSTQELKNIQGVNTDNLIITRNVLALDLMFVPIYGKMAWFNESIVPFDFYFSVGGGSTKTDSENAGTLHLAAGQMFAVSKGSAFRWDFSWNFFNATGVDLKKSAYNNLFFTVGWSWFFPEANYR